MTVRAPLTGGKNRNFVGCSSILYRYSVDKCRRNRIRFDFLVDIIQFFWSNYEKILILVGFWSILWSSFEIMFKKMGMCSVIWWILYCIFEVIVNLCAIFHCVFEVILNIMEWFWGYSQLLCLYYIKILAFFC